MKRNFLNTKGIVSPSSPGLVLTLLVGLLALAHLWVGPKATANNDEARLTPVLILVEGVGKGPGEEVSLYLSEKLVMNDFAITVGIIPSARKEDLLGKELLVTKLRGLHDCYPGKISFALEGLEHLKGELNKPLPEKILLLSRAQSIFTRAFNRAHRDLHDYPLLATTLIPPYADYQPDIAAAARQAGIKVIVRSKTSPFQGYTVLECDVAEVYSDDEVGIVAHWETLEIRSPEEVTASLGDALQITSSKVPLVMTIITGVLYNALGREGAKKYIDTLTALLGEVKEREGGARFITSAEFYQEFIGGKQYIAVRLDDYQTPWTKELFEKVVSDITGLGVPVTIGIIPDARGSKLSEDSQAMDYLNDMIGKGLVEVALHGLDHGEEREFTQPLNDQIETLRDALKESDKILSYEEIFTLIPPYNASNECTPKAIGIVNREGYGIQVLSSSTFGDEYSDRYMFGFDPEGVYHISRNVDPVVSWDSDSPSLYSVEDVLAAIGYDDAVLNIHPYTLRNEKQQDSVLEVIRRLRKRPNVQFVTLRDFYLNIDPTFKLALATWRYSEENTEFSTEPVQPTDEHTMNTMLAPHKVLPPETGCYLGVFAVERELEDDVSVESLKDFEELSGKPVAIASFSSFWGENSVSRQQLDEISRYGALPFLRLMPWGKPYWGPPGYQPDYGLQKIVEGGFDEFLSAWASEINDFGKPVMVTFGMEMNGDWFPWSGKFQGAGGTSRFGDPKRADGLERYVATYRHIIQLFRDGGVENVSWVFQPNWNSLPNEAWNSIEAYYPGDEYIDWVGVSAYGALVNTDPWRSFRSVMGHVYSELTSSFPDKPLMLAEWGVNEGRSTSDKMHWYASALRKLQTTYPKVRMAIVYHGTWENSDGTLSDLRIHSSPEALGVYREGISSDYFVGRVDL